MKRVSTFCVTLAGVLFVLSLFFLSEPEDMVRYYLALVGLALFPLAWDSRRKVKLTAASVAVLSLLAASANYDEGIKHVQMITRFKTMIEFKLFPASQP